MVGASSPRFNWLSNAHLYYTGRKIPLFFGLAAGTSTKQTFRKGDPRTNNQKGSLDGLCYIHDVIHDPPIAMPRSSFGEVNEYRLSCV